MPVEPGGPPTIHVVRSADAPPEPLGGVGEQRVLFGTVRSDGSPVLLGLSTVRPGQTSPLIQHDVAEVTYALAGSGWMVTDASEHPFARGDAMLIDAGCWHAIRADDAIVQMLYVFANPDAPVTRRYGP